MIINVKYHDFFLLNSQNITIFVFHPSFLAFSTCEHGIRCYATLRGKTFVEKLKKNQMGMKTFVEELNKDFFERKDQPEQP